MAPGVRPGLPLPRLLGACFNGAKVYPRPCGGAPVILHQRWLMYGLSPPVRGSLRPSATAFSISGSIPARAGEPGTPYALPNSRAVYPRPCGGASLRSSAPSIFAGLSPPVRGSQVRLAQVRPAQGSIPARAGEPRATMWSPSR